ncbi:SRPBCC domain-containing protein [Cryobacterium sp. PAMC25264]|uniref:SRPBCC domain-containing protein n=1 Tax=Cryobacterium sp. PAMC25264 TaxID=2861288 RepID=UPI001C6300DA|nr:SRPBCC domain-containing protein [Cryobacterium sp. PAMC25264]QYF72801.1 SRPBCC domain-containing protein [Cryobacterium sp. PAMC25264]
MSDHARIKGHTVTRTVHTEASRARVWEALTVPEVMATWFGDSVSFTALDAGATGSVEWEDYGTFPIEITEVVPADSFGFRWSGIPADELDEYSTHVRFSLADAGTGTDVTVVESGFDKLPGGTLYRRDRLEQNREGWDVELDELVILLDGADQ